jgi:hypothetical protein
MRFEEPHNLEGLGEDPYISIGTTKEDIIGSGGNASGVRLLSMLDHDPASRVGSIHLQRWSSPHHQE